MLLGNEFQSFAIPKVPGIEKVVIALTYEVRPDLLLKPRRHRDQWGHPVWLSGLRRRYASLIAGDERVAILLSCADDG